MPQNDYIPTTDALFLSWHDQFKTILASVGAGFNTTNAEIGPVNTHNTDLHSKDTAATTAGASGHYHHPLTEPV